MKSKTILIIIVVLTFANCNESQKTSPNTSTTLIDTFRKATTIIANTGRLDFQLSTRISEVDLSNFDLHGKFFHDRVEFYTSNNSKTNILNAKVQKITLCFIDGILAKSNYKLSENISSHLINTYGKFRFTPLNWVNRDIARNEKIISKEVGQYNINPKLNRYKLKWEMNDKELIYTNKESNEFHDKIFIYTEVLNHYREVFNEVAAVKAFELVDEAN